MNDLKEILNYAEVTDELAEKIAGLKRFEEGLCASLAMIAAEYQVNPRHMEMAKTHFETGFTFAVKGIINHKSADIWGINGK